MKASGDEHFFASPGTDKFFLGQLISRETNVATKSLLVAQYYFRHILLARPLDEVRNLFFGSLVRPPQGGWTARVIEIAAAHDLLPVEVMADEVAMHYIQRWVRQVLDPLGRVAVRAAETGGGLGLVYNGSTEGTLKGREWVLSDWLDGLVLHTNPPIDDDMVQWLMSVFQGYGAALWGILVGPLSLVNDSKLSPFVLKSLTPRQQSIALVMERAKPHLEDRVWRVETERSVYVFVSNAARLRDDGTVIQEKAHLLPGSEIYISYNNSEK